MRRLKPQQRVEIHVEGGDQPIVCRVASVEGSVATLAGVGSIGAELLASFTPAGLGYLVFEHRGTMTALKGIATVSATEGPELAFVVTDGVQLPERRSNGRVQLAIPARLSRSGVNPDGVYIETSTADVSTTGVLVERRLGLEADGEFTLELLLGPDAPIRCGARVARRTPTHVGMRFTDMQDADRARLAGLIRQLAVA
jgi:hypothetical protein